MNSIPETTETETTPARSQAVATRPNTNGAKPPKPTLAQYVKQNRTAVMQSKASHVDLSRLYRVISAQVSTTPALAACSVESIFRSLQQAAQLGLEPGSALGECYLVPYRDTATLIIGYRGLITLARRTGQIKNIQAGVVYEGDVFQVEQGLDPILRHVPYYQSIDPSKILFVYAVALLMDGSKQFEVMSKSEVDGIRSRSRASAGTNTPWATDYAEMAKKTVVRRLCKYLPMSIEMAQGIEVHDGNEFGEVIDLPSDAQVLEEGE